MPEKNSIYLLPIGGLGNRMRAVDSAKALAAESGKNLVVLWKSNFELNCRYDELFEPSKSFRVEEIAESDDYYPRAVRRLKRARWNPFVPTSHIIKEFDFALGDEEISKLYNPKKLSQQTNPETLQEGLYKRFNQEMKPQITAAGTSVYMTSCFRVAPSPAGYPDFTPTPELMGKINAFTSDFENTIGIHIRRTDHGPATRHSGTELFKQKISQLLHANPEQNFLVCTDSQETEQELAAEFGNKILIYPKAYVGRDTKQGIQEALIEMWCLSRTQKIMGSFSSTFSEVAASIGHIPLEIVK